MIKLLLLLGALILGGVFLLRHLPGQPLQGLAHVDEARQMVLVSRARPAVVFVPATDMVGRTAGWRTVRPKGRVMGDEGSARLSLALYDNGQGLLVTALAEAEGDWEWEAPHHTPYPCVYTHEEPVENQMLYESVFTLDTAHNPFGALASEGHTLVYRAKFLLFFRKMQVIFEYHEPLGAAAVRDIAIDSTRQQRILERGRAACMIRFPDKEAAARLAETLQRLDPVDEIFDRTRLGQWLGELLRPRN